MRDHDAEIKNIYKIQNLAKADREELHNICNQIEQKTDSYNAEMDKKMQALTLNFEIEKKQGQINLLTKDQELQELDLRRQKLLRNAVGISGILIFILSLGMLSRYRYVGKTNKIIGFFFVMQSQIYFIIGIVFVSRPAPPACLSRPACPAWTC